MGISFGVLICVSAVQFEAFDREPWFAMLTVKFLKKIMLRYSLDLSELEMVKKYAIVRFDIS